MNGTAPGGRGGRGGAHPRGREWYTGSPMNQIMRILVNCSLVN